LCAAEHSRGRSGFPKRARFVRERERETNFGCGFRSPLEGKKEREKTNTLDLSPNVGKEVHEKRGKKQRIDSQNITYRRKKEKERERERECFLREKRDIFPPFSLSFLCLPRREERVEKQTDIFRITA